MNRIVIVGGGLAAHRAAHVLRKKGHAGEVVVISDEVHAPYDRPPLSKQLLAGSMTREALALPGPDIECDWRLGDPATGLDLDAGVVYAGDQPVSYDGLIIATGRRARPWPHLPELTGFYSLRSVEDAAALADAIVPGVRVVIVGAGFIGCEVAATLRGLGVEQITVVEMAPYPMPVIGAEVGSRAVALHESHGVQLRMSSSVAGFEGADGKVTTVVLGDGERLDADVVLLSLGSMPNTEWLADSGLELLKGAVICDEHCLAVGAESVAVAGDMAAFPFPLVDTPVCIEHWATARDMGAVAAANLIAASEERKPFLAVPTFWSDQYDVKIKSAGMLSLADRYEVVEEDTAENKLIVEAFRGDALIGAIGFNRPRALIDYQRRLAAELVA